MSEYGTAPDPNETKMPKGIPYIIGNEAAERYSFYGMRGILYIFMTKHILDASGAEALMSEEKASAIYHFFVTAVYFTPILGALLSDVFLGKFRTIILLSSIYCFGHLALAVDETRLGLYVGLALISLGAGGIKPCVSAHVGDQFGRGNQKLVSKVFLWFYFAINVGAAAGSWFGPRLLEDYSARLAFGIPGMLMFIATICFWMGRNKFIHVPPSGTKFLKETFSREGLAAMGKLAIVFSFMAFFWALFDQTGSRWIAQAERMDRNFMGIEWLSSQMQVVNPILVLILVPIFMFGVYPFLGKFVEIKPLHKVCAGLILACIPFFIGAWLEARLDAGETPNIGWQILQYFFLTIAEVLASITVLEFAYTQAPKSMKSWVMSLNMLSVSIGNLFTGIVNIFIANPDGSSKLEGPAYFNFFAFLMLGAGIVFIPVAVLYKEKRYVQGEDAASIVSEEEIDSEIEP